MQPEPIELFPAHRVIDPARFAAARRRLFTARNLHIGRSTVVHAVDWPQWISGLTLPAPACHQGWSGLGAAGELLPTRLAVSCLKCRRLAGLPDVDGGAGEEWVLFRLPAVASE